MVGVGDAYAKAFARAAALEEGKKSRLAVLMKKHEQLGHKTTAAQEREARADPEYQALIEALESAIEERERYRWTLELAKLSIGLYQTMQANQRQERRAYGA